MKKVLVVLLSISVTLNILLYRECLWMAETAKKEQKSHKETLKSYSEFQDEVSSFVKDVKTLREKR